MRKPSERFDPVPLLLVVVTLVVPGILTTTAGQPLLTPPARAQEADTGAETGAETGATDDSPEALAARLEEDWRLLPLRDGVVLTPRAENAPVSAVEITGDGGAVDGQPVAEAELEERLGELAGPVLALLALDADGRRRVLEQAGSGLAPGGATAAPDAGREGAPEVGEPPSPEAKEAPEPPAEPVAPPRPKVRIGDKVSFVGSVTIDEDESAREVVVIGGNLRVRGEVEGTALVVGGNAFVDGRIGKELMVVGGRIELGPDAVVDGEINLVSGRLDRDEGAQIRGRINEIGVMGQWRDGALELDFDRPRFRIMAWVSDVFNSLFALAVLALAACAVILLGEDLVIQVGRQLAADPWKAGAAGLLFQVLFLPLLALTALILVISIIGIPLVLLIPFVLLGLCLAAFVGYVVSAHGLGKVILGRFGRAPTSSYLTVLVGVVGLGVWSVLCRALDLPFLAFITGLLGFMAILVNYIAWTFGGGALLLYYLRRRREKKAAALARPGFTSSGGPAGTTGAGGDPGAPPSPPPSAPPPEPPADDRG